MYWHKTPALVKSLFPQFLWDKPEDTKTIYLTFDDGPIPEVTDFVLEELSTFKAKATFFVVGDNVRKYPEIFNRVIDNGHSAGNHTYNHLNGWRTTATEYLDNISLCQNEFSKQGYARIVKLFRPPYGLIKRQQAQKLNGDYKIVMWDVLTGDFDKSLSPDKCLSKTLAAVSDGSIVVFHDSKKSERRLKYVLPRVLQHFSDQDYTFAAL